MIVLGGMCLVVAGGGWISASSTFYGYCSFTGECARAYGGILIETVGILGVIVVVTVLLTRAIRKALHRSAGGGA
jgi:hypothetical protein